MSNIYWRKKQLYETWQYLRCTWHDRNTSRGVWTMKLCYRSLFFLSVMFFFISVKTTWKNFTEFRVFTPAGISFHQLLIFCAIFISFICRDVEKIESSKTNGDTRRDRSRREIEEFSIERGKFGRYFSATHLAFPSSVRIYYRIYCLLFSSRCIHESRESPDTRSGCGKLHARLIYRPMAAIDRRLGRGTRPIRSAR